LKLDFGRFSWLNHRINYENIEVWRPFKDFIVDSQDQRPTYKWCVIVGVEIDQSRGQIERDWNFGSQLRLKLNKLKTKDLFVKGAQMKEFKSEFLGV